MSKACLLQLFHILALHGSVTALVRLQGRREGLDLDEGAHLIRPCFDPSCQKWADTNGDRIEAHAGGMLRSPQDGRWYWYGESAKAEAKTDLAGSVGGGVSCYSAERLTGPWRNEGRVLSQDQIAVEGFSGPFVVERPKVLFNQASSKYVMWFHADNATYKMRHVGVATSDSAVGPFQVSHVFRPDGLASLDMSLFQDFDGRAYFVRSVDNSYFAISSLSEDFLNTTGVLSKGNGFISGNQPCLEGFAMFRHPYNSSGKLYMMTSHCDYWRPNPLSLLRADGANLSSPKWFNLGNPTSDYNSFNSQPSFVVQSELASGEVYPVYMGDNWIHGGERGLPDASYVWLPLDLRRDGHVFMDKMESWSLLQPFAEDYTYDHSATCQSNQGGEHSKCWVRLPDGCSKPLGESQTPRSWFLVPDETTWQSCTQRVADFKVWCEVRTAEHVWAPAAPTRKCHPSKEALARPACWIRLREGCTRQASLLRLHSSQLSLPCWVNKGGCRDPPKRPHYLETASSTDWFLAMDPERATHATCKVRAQELDWGCNRTGNEFAWAPQPPS